MSTACTPPFPVVGGRPRPSRVGRWAKLLPMTTAPATGCGPPNPPRSSSRAPSAGMLLLWPGRVEPNAFLGGSRRFVTPAAGLVVRVAGDASLKWMCANLSATPPKASVGAPREKRGVRLQDRGTKLRAKALPSGW